MTQNIIKTFAHAFMLSSGFKRRCMAIAAGACGALAMPPFDFFPALILPMSAAIWLIDGCVSGSRPGGLSSRLKGAFEAAKDGYWLGLGFFLAGLWWLGTAFLVEADRFAWAMPLGVVGLPAALSGFFAFGFAVARLMWSTGAQRIFALAAGLGLAEWLRSVLFTGFPWNALGMSLGSTPLTAQAAAFVGLHGLTVIAIFLAAAPATLTDKEPARNFLKPTLLACLAFAALLLGGLIRISAPATSLEPGVRLRIMQPNLPQDVKFRPEEMEKILTKYLSLSDSSTSPRNSGIADVTHLIWPESPFPVVLANNPRYMQKIAAFLPEGSTLVTGAIKAEKQASGNRQTLYMNSIYVVDADGALVDSYDKVHLVPFGEYLPFQTLLEYLHLRQFVQIPGGFTPGERRGPLRVPGLPMVAPLICYEAIFPGAVTPVSVRPGLLLNVTNDAWFGATPGPYQHFAQARLRAIEEGLPLVRAANSGISAIIDPLGRTISELPLGAEGVLDGPLPGRLPPTVFSRFPITAPFLVLFLAFTGALWPFRRPR